MSLMDPEDQEFGRKAAQDQEKVDELERQGVSEEDLSDEPPSHEPRPAVKPMSLEDLVDRAASRGPRRRIAKKM